MAILDALLMFEPIAGTAVTATAASTNTIDLSQAVDLVDEHLWLDVDWLALPTASGSATVNVQLEGSTDDSTWVVLEETGVQAISVWTSTHMGIWQTRVGNFLGLYRYLRLNYVIATGPLTAGTIFARLQTDVERRIAYPRNYVS